MQPRANVRHLVLTAFLVLLLGTLATLQYRWLGDVSAAERERLRASLRARATDFTADFDRAITGLFAGFRVDAGSMDREPAGTILAAFNRAASSSPAAASLIRKVYLFDGAASGGDELRVLDVDRATLEPAAWPAELESWRRLTDLMPPMPQAIGKELPVFFANTLDAKTPALIIGIPRLPPAGRAEAPESNPRPRALVRAAIVLLDKQALKDRLIEPLAAKHFGTGPASEYVVAVVRRDDPSDVIYASSSEPVNERTADVSASFFALRADDINNLDLNLTRLRAAAKGNVAITIFRRGETAGPVRMIAHAQDGAWDLLIRCRAGSLEAVVAQSRRRNIGIGLGVLALLGASFVLVVVSAQRQQRLARQQMEFVASVSHELRTPLAVICSAGENLADGVVADREQVKQYGALVQTEGRRLADMVERVMEFAGISAGGLRRPHTDVDVAALVAQVAAAVGIEARRRNIEVRVRTGSQLPRVLGDPDGLRSALQNIVGNAVKYSPDGAAVDVAVEAIRTGVRVRVADRGIGIDADELPRVFEPFFRGRRAIDRQLRGTGVGLSVVKQVADAHGGDIRIESGPDAGTVVTLELPAAPDNPPPAAAEVSHAS